MENIQWNKSLSVGIELIDEQHRKWIQCLNDLAAAVQSHEGPAQIAKTLSFLVDYTAMHAATEEKYMAANNYPEFDLHRQKHEEVKRALANLDQDFTEEGATEALALSIKTFLENWLIRHIQEVDRKFGDFVKRKGIVIS